MSDLSLGKAIYTAQYLITRFYTRSLVKIHIINICDDMIGLQYWTSFQEKKKKKHFYHALHYKRPGHMQIHIL